MRQMLLCCTMAAAALATSSICSPPASAHEPADAAASRTLDLAVPTTVVQGGLVRGHLPAGASVSIAVDPATGEDGPLRALQVTDHGSFIFGASRDRTSPIRVEVVLPDESRREFMITVISRRWQLERVSGVPEATVNPPPAIAERIAREQSSVAQARTRDDARDDFTSTFHWPLTGRISGVYGSQRIYNGTPKSPHSGVDVAARTGTPVHAPAAGIITFAKPDLYLTGGTVLIDHGHGLSSSFLHLSRIDVRVGDRVEQDQVIGLVGATGRATGPHMHWGMNWFGVRVDPQLLVGPMPAVEPSAGATPSR